jgi:hypothetical protein
LLLLCVLGVYYTIYWTIYPERHAHEYDLGTNRQRAVMQRYRRIMSQVSLKRRFQYALAWPFRRKRARPRA